MRRPVARAALWPTTAALCALCLGGGGRSALADDSLSEANRLARAGDREGAARLYEMEVARDPDNFEAHERLAVQRIWLGRHEEVVAQLEPVVARAPDRAGALYSLAYCYRKVGRAADAVRTYAAYMRMRPESADPYYGYALALLDAGDHDAASKALRTYLAMEQRSEERVWVERARAILARIDARRASTAGDEVDVEARRTAVRDRPMDPSAWDDLAKALREVGRDREAGIAARRAERLRAGPTAAPVRSAAAAEPQRPELVDALMPPEEERAAVDAAEKKERVRLEREERRRRAADDKMMRDERRRLARQDARRMREENAARKKAAREESRRLRDEKRGQGAAGVVVPVLDLDDEAEVAPESATASSTSSPTPSATALPAVAAPTAAETPPVMPPDVPADLGPHDIERLRTAVRDDPDDARSWYLLAAALRSGGRAAEATIAERRYTRLAGSSPSK